MRIRGIFRQINSKYVHILQKKHKNIHSMHARFSPFLIDRLEMTHKYNRLNMAMIPNRRGAY